MQDIAATHPMINLKYSASAGRCSFCSSKVQTRILVITKHIKYLLYRTAEHAKLPVMLIGRRNQEKRLERCRARVRKFCVKTLEKHDVKTRSRPFALSLDVMN